MKEATIDPTADQNFRRRRLSLGDALRRRRWQRGRPAGSREHRAYATARQSPIRPGPRAAPARPRTRQRPATRAAKRAGRRAWGADQGPRAAPAPCACQNPSALQRPLATQPATCGPSQTSSTPTEPAASSSDRARRRQEPRAGAFIPLKRSSSTFHDAHPKKKFAERERRARSGGIVRRPPRQATQLHCHVPSLVANVRAGTPACRTARSSRHVRRQRSRVENLMTALCDTPQRPVLAGPVRRIAGRQRTIARGKALA